GRGCAARPPVSNRSARAQPDHFRVPSVVKSDSPTYDTQASFALYEATTLLPDSHPCSSSAHSDGHQQPRYGQRRKSDEHGDQRFRRPHGHDAIVLGSQLARPSEAEHINAAEHAASNG